MAAKESFIFPTYVIERCCERLNSLLPIAVLSFSTSKAFMFVTVTLKNDSFGNSEFLNRKMSC